jgi:DNA-binding NarL/FixJ family response regulator
MTTKLTPLEQTVMFCIWAGMKHKNIAQTLGCSIAAVTSTTQRIYNKIGASNRVEAVNFAIHRGHIHATYGYWGA